MQTFYSASNIETMEQRFRTNLINSLSGFKSLNLIATRDLRQNTNLAIFNSVIHLGANPALMAFVVRPDSVERHTLENILETGYFTINHIHQAIIKQAHQTAARYPKNISEFTATGLTPELKNNFYAPYVKESALQIGLQFKERVDIALNGTSIIVGQIEQLYLPTHVIATDGFVNLEEAGTVTGIGLDSYHATKQITRLTYAKPDKALQELVTTYLHERE